MIAQIKRQVALDAIGMPLTLSAKVVVHRNKITTREIACTCPTTRNSLWLLLLRCSPTGHTSRLQTRSLTAMCPILITGAPLNNKVSMFAHRTVNKSIQFNTGIPHRLRLMQRDRRSHSATTNLPRMASPLAHSQLIQNRTLITVLRILYIELLPHHPTNLRSVLFFLMVI